MSEENKFNPTDHLIDLKGKPYLETAFRIAWFRSEHPEGQILTTIQEIPNDYNNAFIVSAKILNSDSVVLSTGTGMCVTGQKKVYAGREIEKAETAAIGRALAHAGYGTQFTGESEADFLADSPVGKAEAPAKKKPAKPAPATPAPAKQGETRRIFQPVDLQKYITSKAVNDYLDHTASMKFRGFVAGHLTSMGQGDDDRYAVTKFLTGETSIKDIPDGMVFALRDWMGLADGSEPNEAAKTEFQMILEYLERKE